MKIKVQCKECGKIEYVSPCRANKYCTCSVECLGKYNAKRYSTKIKKVCPVCGKIFEVKKSHAERRVCCSKKCHNATLPTKFLGSGNPNYRGRVTNSDGYAKNTKFTVHRETVMQILGVSELPKTLLVHHKDGDKYNNDPHNLILLTHKWHTWLHKNIGNFVFKALYTGKMTIQDVLDITPLEYQEQVKYMLSVDCTQQSAVLKQGELLGSSIYNCDNIGEVISSQASEAQTKSLEGSTTNG